MSGETVPGTSERLNALQPGEVLTMFWTIVALIMTVMMGGIIAYNGDLIGRKYGKRRVTMFGMRPKHTAILITSLTGVAISAITTGVLFLVVKPVREVILYGQEAIEKNPTLIKQIARNLETIDKQNMDLSHLGALKHQEEINTAQAETRRTQAEKNLRAVEAKLGPLQTKLNATETTLKAEQAQLAQTRSQNVQLVSKNNELKVKTDQLVINAEALAKNIVQLTASKQKLTDDNTTLTKQNKELAQENDDRSNRNVELTRQNTKLSHANDALLRTSDVLRQANDQLESTNQSLVSTKNKLASDNTRLATENRELDKLLKEIAPGYKSLKDAYLAARNTRVVIHKDEDLARKVVPANSPPETVRELIMGLMHDAGQAALSKGAGVGDQARAVQVVDRQYLIRNSDGQLVGAEVSGSERVEAVVSRLAWQTNPIAVLAIAVSNTVEQEPAAIDFQPFPSKLVYSKGQPVVSKVINAVQTPERIFDAVVAFLKEMGQTALEHGVIPRMDGITGEPQVGSLNGGDVVKLVERVREVGGRVHIRAVATKDINSADLLAVDFIIGQ